MTYEIPEISFSVLRLQTLQAADEEGNETGKEAIQEAAERREKFQVATSFATKIVSTIQEGQIKLGCIDFYCTIDCLRLKIYYQFHHDCNKYQMTQKTWSSL